MFFHTLLLLPAVLSLASAASKPEKRDEGLLGELGDDLEQAIGGMLDATASPTGRPAMTGWPFPHRPYPSGHIPSGWHHWGPPPSGSWSHPQGPPPTGAPSGAGHGQSVSKPKPTPTSSKMATSVRTKPKTSSKASKPTSSSKTSVKATSKTSASPKASSTSTSGGSSSAAGLDSFAQAALTGHNTFRKTWSAEPLQWNATLASAAQEWANQCNWSHSGGAVGPYGENLAAGYSDITAALGGWESEAANYSSSDPSASHFTQMVWQSTTDLGCAVASCDLTSQVPQLSNPAQYVVCEYYPPGNVYPADQYFPDNVGPKAS